MVVHDVAVDVPCSLRDNEFGLQGAAAGAGRAGRVPQRAALAAALDTKLATFDAGPEERGVGGDDRPWLRTARRVRDDPRAELQHPEAHLGHRLAVDGPGAVGGHEPALAERCSLGAVD